MGLPLWWRRPRTSKGYDMAKIRCMVLAVDECQYVRMPRYMTRTNLFDCCTKSCGRSRDIDWILNIV